jgi:hypothetical protein
MTSLKRVKFLKDSAYDLINNTKKCVKLSHSISSKILLLILVLNKIARSCKFNFKYLSFFFCNLRQRSIIASVFIATLIYYQFIMVVYIFSGQVSLLQNKFQASQNKKQKQRKIYLNLIVYNQN